MFAFELPPLCTLNMTVKNALCVVSASRDDANQHIRCEIQRAEAPTQTDSQMASKVHNLLNTGVEVTSIQPKKGTSECAPRELEAVSSLSGTTKRHAFKILHCLSLASAHRIDFTLTTIARVSLSSLVLSPSHALEHIYSCLYGGVLLRWGRDGAMTLFLLKARVHRKQKQENVPRKRTYKIIQ